MIPNYLTPDMASPSRLTIIRALSDWQKVLRYFIAGASVSIGYTITFIFIMRFLDWKSAAEANTVSFLIWTPASYFAQRNFTFRRRERDSLSIMKFAFISMIKLLVSMAVVYILSDTLRFGYVVSIAVNWIALPLVAYAALAMWVFRERESIELN